MPPSADCSALIERAKAGDVRAFETLVAAELPRVRRFARSMCRSQADADDLAQDALLKAYTSIHGYRFQAAFSTWLFRIVRNTLIDYTRSAAGRRQTRTEALDASRDPVAQAKDAPDQALSRKQLRDSIWDALSAIPLDFRTAIVLFEVEGFSLEEVAAIEAVPVGTIKSRLARARAQLRSVLLSRGVVERGNRAAADLVQPRSLR